MKAFATTLAVTLLCGAAEARAQHEHHHGSGHTPDHDHGDHHEHAATTVEAGMTVEAASIDAGAYQGVSPTVAVTHRGFGLRVVVPTYHIERHDLQDTGLGDVIVSAHAPIAAGDAWALGAVAAVGAPTGDMDDGLGMGHVMVMPSLFAVIRHVGWSATAHVGGGKSLGGGDDDHQHGGSLVSPMNPSEVGGSLRVGRPVVAALSAHATAGVAVPIGDGVTRSTAGVGARYALTAADFGVEVHLPVAGDPYSVRVVADAAYRF